MGLLEENANAGPELFGLTVRVRNSREFKRFCLKKQSFRQTCTVRKAVIKLIIVVSELILFLNRSVGELRASNKRLTECDVNCQVSAHLDVVKVRLGFRLGIADGQ